MASRGNALLFALYAAWFVLGMTIYLWGIPMSKVSKPTRRVHP